MYGHSKAPAGCGLIDGIYQCEHIVGSQVLPMTVIVSTCDLIEKRYLPL